MSLEVFNTAASVGTFVVIALTAVAALRQIPVLRQTNQVAALSALLDRWEAPAMRDAYRFLTVTVPHQLVEPAFRAGFASNPVHSDVRQALVVLNFFETLGIYVSLGIIRQDAALQFYSGIITRTWEAARPALAILRRNGPCYEHFEYLAYLSKAIPSDVDDYPANVPRMPLDDVWLTEDLRLKEKGNAGEARDQQG